MVGGPDDGPLELDCSEFSGDLLPDNGLSLSSFLSLDCGLPSCPGDVIPLEGLGGGCVLALSLEFSELFVAVRLELPSRGGPGA